MLPVVNGKPLIDCSEDDLQVLIDNPDYRENQWLDYKATFSFLECDKKDPKRNKHLAEFRSDVCAFANADGGYLVFGIRDEKGMAAEIVGIDIPDENTDRFELDRKNNLCSVMPKFPPIKFRFLKLQSGKFVVILRIERDYFAPYVHLEDESNYKIYKRIGNGKTCIGYSELKNMFNQSLSIEKEVQRYREERISDFKNIEDTAEHWYTQFLLLHIIPDTFTDSSHNKNIFWLWRSKGIKFGDMFSCVGCSSTTIPNVDGVRYPGYRTGEECRLNNNCVTEVFLPLYDYLNIGHVSDQCPTGYLASTSIFGKIATVAQEFITTMRGILDTNRIFVCITIVGCKEVCTDNDFYIDYKGKIDRNKVLCNPVVFEDISSDEVVGHAMKQLELEYKLALGIKNAKAINELMQEVYPE